jgi:hypothetical protein
MADGKRDFFVMCYQTFEIGSPIFVFASRMLKKAVQQGRSE